MDTPVGQKTCPKCGRVVPATEFFFGTQSLAYDECTECVWERMCQIPQADLHKIAAIQRSRQEAKPHVFRRGYRRYYRDSRETILGRLRHRSATQVEAGYVAFGAQMRKRGDPRHGAGGWHTSEDVERLYDEQGGCCFYCGKKLNAEYDLDHKIPLSRGGTDWPENLCCACEWCNSRKQSKTAAEFTEYLINLRRRP